MFKGIEVRSVSSPVTVLGIVSDAKVPEGAPGFDRAATSAAADACDSPRFKAEPGETFPLGKSHLLVGLGPRADLTAAQLRLVGARLVKELDRLEVQAAKLCVTQSIPDAVLAPDVAMQCLGEGMALANWRVDFFDGTATKRSPVRPALKVQPDAAKLRKALQRGLTLAECTNYARRLAATPPNICNPAWIAGEARKLARQVGLKCTVISYARAKELGMGGLVNVGKGSASKPCLVILEHNPAKAKKRRALALVGKTITYDTGGYSLKVSNGMKGMKYDKCGGMAVLGAMRAVALLNVPLRVVGVLPAAENMVGEDAYRPDDIITMYNGVSVEVTNTDAEGRLVLADALAYTCAKLKPTAVVDVATLTGGVVVALGSSCCGAWCDDEQLLGLLQNAADRSGEKIWRLPLWSEHRDFMRAKHADIWNSGPKRDAHPIQGAAFLSYFVDPGVPWAHLDIAGVNNVDADTDLYVQGPTGYGVRLLTGLAEGYAAGR